MNAPTFFLKLLLNSPAIAFIFSFLLFSAPHIYAIDQKEKINLHSQAMEIFEKKCSGCHHPDTKDELPYLHSESDIAELVEVDEAIVVGKPEESSIYTLVIRDKSSSKRMPKSKGAPGDKSWKEPLSEPETEVLKNWILALAEVEDAPQPGSNQSRSSSEIDPETEKLIITELTEDQLEQEVRAVFTNRCEQCHNPDDVNQPDLSLPLAEFTFKSSPDDMSIAENVMTRVLLPHGHDEKMPEAPEEELSPTEIEILQTWFDSDADNRVKREPIYYADMVRQISDDLREASVGSGEYLRYFTLTNLYNVSRPDGFAEHSDQEMDTFRAAISKLMNSLSMNARITPPIAIDEERTIYRVDLRDYKWKPEDWERVVNYYPHGILGVDSRSEKQIYDTTGSRMAYLRGDWFTFAASQPPLYDDILDYLMGIYSTDHKGAQHRLEARLGVDRVNNLQQGNAIRAGFFESGVSDHNRLIERHESNYGAYWMSYDFKHRGAGPYQDLRKAPLGPKEAYLTDDPNLVFEHDGGEMIYTLPNGMQGYLLADVHGTRLDRAPVDIVRTSKGDGSIINGISCMNCHDKGMKAAVKIDPMLSAMEDQVRPFVEKSNILGGRDYGTFRDLYVEKADLQKALMTDYERFKKANDEALMGLETLGEPITKLYDSYYLKRIDSQRLSAEFGIDHSEMMELLEEESFASTGFRTVYQGLENGDAESRQQLMQQFLQIAYVLDYQILPFDPLGYEEFHGEAFAEKVRHDPIYIALFGGDFSHRKKGTQWLAQDAHRAKVAITNTAAAAKSHSENSVLWSGGGKLWASVDSEIWVGKHGALNIEANRDLYVQVLLFTADGKVTQFFPNKTNPDNWVPFSKWKGRPFTIPFETTANWDGSIGSEYFKIYASEAPLTLTKKGQSVDGFQEFSRSQLISTRGAVAMKAGFGKSSPPKHTTIHKPHRIYETKVGYILRK